MKINTRQELVVVQVVIPLIRSQVKNAEARRFNQPPAQVVIPLIRSQVKNLSVSLGF